MSPSDEPAIERLPRDPPNVAEHAARRRIRTARIVAIVADVLQIAFFPLFVSGWLSPLDDVVDVAVAVILIRLIGWHPAFVPSLIAEIVPGLDLLPTWTVAVW